MRQDCESSYPRPAVLYEDKNTLNLKDTFKGSSESGVDVWGVKEESDEGRRAWKSWPQG